MAKKWHSQSRFILTNAVTAAAQIVDQAGTTKGALFHHFEDKNDLVEAAFSRGIKAGTVRKGISPPRVAALVVAALEGIIGTAKNAQSDKLLIQAGQAFFDYLDSLKP